MFSRRPIVSHNRGRSSSGGGGAPVPDPLEIMVGNIQAYWRADAATEGATFTLLDTGPGGHDLVQATATNQPSLNATGGPNGTPSILFDGVDNRLVNATLDLNAPGTEMTVYWAILRQVTWTSTRRLWCASNASAVTLCIIQSATTPNIRAHNGTDGPENAGLILNTYSTVYAEFRNNTADVLVAAGTSVTGTATGNANPGAGFVLGATGNLALHSNIEVCELAVFNAIPDAEQATALAAYRLDRYGLAA